MLDLLDAIRGIAKKTLPEPLHKKHWLKEMHAMRIHTRGSDPGDLLRQRHNEPPELYKWRKANYSPITTPIIQRAINNLSRILQQSGYTRRTSETLTEYLSLLDFEGHDFFTYLLAKVMPAMIEDPNGYIVWQPDGMGIADPTQPVLPTPHIIHSDDIIYQDPDTMVVKTQAKSIVLIGDKAQRAGEVYFWISKNEFAVIEQYGKQHDRLFAVPEDLPPYSHNLNQLPVVQLKGDWDTSGWYRSFFSSFVPFGNELIKQYSDYSCVLATSSFPVQQYIVHPCEAPGCVQGIVYTEDGNQHPCTACGGSGQRILTGPNNILLKPVPNAAMGEQAITEDLLKYISPDVGILDFGQRAVERMEKNCEKSLALLYIDEAQSGTAKEIDREQLYVMLAKISENIYDNIVWNSLWIMERLINISNPEPPTVIKPINFKTKSESELAAELDQAVKMSAAKEVAVSAFRELSAKRYGGDDVAQKRTEVLIQFDPLLTASLSEKQAMLSNNVITVRDWQASNLASAALTAVVKELGEVAFLEADFATIEAAMNEYINARIPPPALPTPESIANTLA